MDDLDEWDSADEVDAGLPTEGGKRVKASSLLWFISSRSYVPMADIRRRFNLFTESGALLRDEEGVVHIGLPRQAAETLLDLKRRRKVDLEYDLEHAARIAVGVYPLRIRLLPPPPPPPIRRPGPPPGVRAAPTEGPPREPGARGPAPGTARPAPWAADAAGQVAPPDAAVEAEAAGEPEVPAEPGEAPAADTAPGTDAGRRRRRRRRR